MVPGYGRNDKQITLGQMQLIKACVAHLTIRRARLDWDRVFRRPQKESVKMAAKHVPIYGGQHSGPTAGISMVELVSGILRHTPWVWAHVVEICKPPNVRRQPVNHHFA